VLDQPTPELRQNRNVADASLGLDRDVGAIVAGELPADADRRSVEIDVLPAQAQRLAGTRACGDVP
jgi:hypothetical protein